VYLNIVENYNWIVNSKFFILIKLGHNLITSTSIVQMELVILKWHMKTAQTIFSHATYIIVHHINLHIN